MLHIFAGHPPNVSDEMLRRMGHAGATRAFIVENEIGLLEERPIIQWRREGVFILSFNDKKERIGEEQIAEAHFVVSPALQSVYFRPNEVAEVWLDFEGKSVRCDSALIEDFALGNTVTCAARASMVRPLPLLTPFRDPLHTNPETGQVVNFRHPKWERSIWLSWCCFQHPLPYFAYCKLLAWMEGSDTMFPSKGDYDAMMPSREIVLPTIGETKYYGGTRMAQKGVP